ncbi:hypothetical protein NCS55_01481000 [Fusarium keratoplasticum]|nr:hypothetical protein NCS55_01481000 [Fusarium keratoplasticum]
MKSPQLSKANRLAIIIGISFSFFCAEIAVGFYTRSLALVADAFHYLNDLIGFIVGLVAFKVAVPLNQISEQGDSPKELSFGWQRANLLDVKNSKLVLIIGCVGLALNIISATLLHEHDEDVRMVVDGTEDGTEGRESMRATAHQEHHHETAPAEKKKAGHDHDLGLMGVFLHVVGDAVNNIGVIIAASIIWKTSSPARFYADPAVSMAIALMIFFSSWPLVFKTGTVLMGSVPKGVDLKDVQQDLEKVPGVVSVHELHIWRLNQRKSIASAHVVVSDKYLPNFMDVAETVSECFHAYGIHSATLQPELATLTTNETGNAESSSQGLRHRKPNNLTCSINCGSTLCQPLTLLRLIAPRFVLGFTLCGSLMKGGWCTTICHYDPRIPLDERR